MQPFFITKHFSSFQQQRFYFSLFERDGAGWKLHGLAPTKERKIDDVFQPPFGGCVCTRGQMAQH